MTGERASAPGLGRDSAPIEVAECSVCGNPIGFASDGVPYHLGCSLDGDHDVCDPDDGHIPT